jgi:hypothetical protein
MKMGLPNNLSDKYERRIAFYKTKTRVIKMRSNLSRREFNRLTSAALGGMVTGALVGCSGDKKPAAPGANVPGDTTVAVALHACRGLNECKGKGADGKNACAGQGTCHTAKAHDCATQNDCKHQGGCGQDPGYNNCKGMGGCAVPMAGGMWEKARKRLEEEVQKQGKTAGAAPPAAKG